MKTKISTTLLLMTVMFLASCGSGNSEIKTENTATEQIVSAKYQCPMKCEGEKTYDKPGQCPVCNMDLKKLAAPHEHSDTTSHQH